MLIVHGLNSHSAYYRNFAAQLSENHYEVYAGDLRGRGESEGADEKQPARTMQQLILAGELLKSKMPELKLPVLILHGTADRATNFAGSEYFMKHAGSEDKQLELYEGYYHDLLNDHSGAMVVKDIISWLNKRV